MKLGRLAWVVAGVDVVAFLVASTLDPVFDHSGTVLYVLGIMSFTAVGALLHTRVPANPIGAMLLIAGTALVAALVIGSYATIGALQVPPWPGSDTARIVGSTLFVYPFAIALIGVPLVFPDGRLPSRRFRWVAWITVASMIAFSLGALLGPPTDGTTGGSDAGLSGPTPIVVVLQAFVLVSLVVSFGAAVVAIGIRFRGGDPVQRQQVKWLVAVVALGAVILPLSLVPVAFDSEVGNVLSTIAILTLFAIPVVIAVAILRYRLYEIDRIISRTIGYALVTAVLAAVFLATNLGLQAVVVSATGASTVGVAASTLLVAALFQPLRRIVQTPIDRRFNRARIDGERVLAAFGDRVREEVDLARLRGAVVATADEAVRPARSGLWLRGAPAPDGRRR